jgi:ParB family transcriptional regulator, chromosome partitioning protein
MSDQKRLGKGLEALFGENVNAVLEELQQTGSGSVEIALSDIHPNPYQPRQVFDEIKLQELANSIQEHGVFTPILVRKSVSGYQIIAGERRFRASKLAKIEKIPAIVLEFDDTQMMEISLIENIQREDLSVIEEAKAYQLMMERLNYTQDQVAQKVGKSRPHISNTLRLLTLPQSVLDLLASQKISMGQVKPLINHEDKVLVERLAQEIVDKNLSSRDVERLMKEKKQKTIKTNTDYRYVESLLRTKLHAKVSIDSHNIKIHFDDDEDLNRLLELMDAIEK